MTMPIQPEYRTVVLKHTAASKCCGAKLRLGKETEFECIECEQSCERIFTETEEIDSWPPDSRLTPQTSL